jgi:regulator of RNase E activity RraA
MSKESNSMSLNLLANQSQLRRQLSSGALCDALDAAGMWSVLPSSIHRMAGEPRSFFGRAYTVSWQPTRKQADIRALSQSTWEQVRQFLIPGDQSVEGMVYVAGAPGGSIDRYALAGGLSTRQFEQLGMEAVVLCGAVRDADEVATRSIPVFATGFSPLDSQGNYRVASAGDECLVGDIRVQTGDWVFGDTTGIVVLPARFAADIVERALAILEVEANVLEKLTAGASLLDVLNRSGHI